MSQSPILEGSTPKQDIVSLLQNHNSKYINKNLNPNRDQVKSVTSSIRRNISSRGGFSVKQDPVEDSAKQPGRVLKISQDKGMTYFHIPKRERFNEEAELEIEIQKVENKIKQHLSKGKILKKGTLSQIDDESRMAASEGDKSRMTGSTRVKTVCSGKTISNAALSKFFENRKKKEVSNATKSDRGSMIKQLKQKSSKAALPKPRPHFDEETSQIKNRRYLADKPKS
jgi:hypothetical protein